jgi:excisionase family DNA binding protein
MVTITITSKSAAVFAAMLDKPLRRRCSPASGIHPDTAAELLADLEVLRGAGESWRRARLISVVPRLPTEIDSDSSAMEIDTGTAAELLDRTASRVRQLLRRGELAGRRVGHRWLIRRADVLSYVGKAAA